MAIQKEKREAIARQAVEEMLFSRQHKRPKLANWQKNEEMYYGKKQKQEDSRANVELGRVQEFVHTLLSKIDTPMTFKYQKRKVSQLKRVARLNSLRDFDSQRDYWELKDLVGKKQAILYGRAIYSYHATPDYMPYLENVDVYDFLIDPLAGGIDLEKARYMGRYGVTKNRYQLKKGPYIQSVVAEMKSTYDAQQRQDMRARELASGTSINELEDEDTFTFWEWYTTYKGDRYYLLMTDSGTVVRCEPLGELFDNEQYPFWSYASFPDLTEFWTPSHIDYVREIFMAQSASINQMLDNAERVNKPQKIVDVGAVQDLDQLKYKKDGHILTNMGQAMSAIKLVEVPSIDTPIQVFNVLESIQEKSMGISAAEKGLAETDGRATIYEGNRETAADRYGLLNKSYSYAYRRFAALYEQGVRQHLNKKIAVDILGPEGIEIQNISKRDIFRGNETFAVQVEASDAEIAMSENKKRTILAFLSAHLQDPTINQKKSTEIQAKIAGLEEQQVRELLDTSEFGDAEIMSEAERDIEDLLDGGTVKPNRMANTAYKQRIVNYLNDNMEHMNDEQIQRMFRYIESLDQIILGNTMRQAQQQAQKEMQAGGGVEAGRLRAPGPAQPLADVIQQNT
jgi:hypothetical protein